MNVSETDLPGVLLIRPNVFEDERGFFMETWHGPRYADAGVTATFVQDNLSMSAKWVLRGLHLQNPRQQGKLVYVPRGEIFDVAVDVRVGSPTFGRWTGQYLSSRNREQLWVPEGFAHGFVVTSPRALFAYKCTEVYDADTELAIRWDDPALGIEWPVSEPIVSDRDRAAPLLAEIDEDRLPRYLPPAA